MKKLYIISVTLILFTYACKTMAPQQSFSMGKGGGITGKYIEYLVKSNGEVYDISNGQSPNLFRTFEKDKINEIFKQFGQLNISTINFSHPGNVTYYIRYEANNKTYEIKWGDTKNAPPKNAYDFFESLWSDIRPK